MKNTILKIALFSVFIAIIISLAGCASEDTAINAASDVSDSSVSSSVSEKESSTSSKLQTTTSKNTSSSNTTTSKKPNSSNTTTTSSKKPVTSTESEASSSTPAPSEKPALSYTAIQTKAEDFLKKNTVHTPDSSDTFHVYTLDESYFIIPKDFLKPQPFYSDVFTSVKDGEEYISEVNMCQYTDYLYTSKVQAAFFRDLKILEEFAGCKASKITFKNVLDNKSFEKVSDIPDNYLRVFSKGSQSPPRIYVYFNDDHPTNPLKVFASFACYSLSQHNLPGPVKYNYFIDISVRYNREKPATY